MRASQTGLTRQLRRCCPWQREAIAEAIESVSGLAPSLKWPNDVYLGSPGFSRKVAGILAEGGVWRGQTWIVMGFGI